MVNATPRPMDEDLRGYLLGKLVPERANLVEAWVHEHPESAAILEGLPANDPLTDALAAIGPADTAYPAEADRIVRNVCAMTAMPAAIQFGEYRIVRLLGWGGMGTVYEAEDDRLKRRAAIKVLAPNIALEAGARQRFLDEGRAVAAIESDHVVRIYRADEQDGVPYLAMELLKGSTLEEWLEERPGPATAEEVLWVAQHVLRGLAAAHERGLIHRDIKPANLWVEEGTKRVKVLDLGVARPVHRETRTVFGSIVGTPAYMSPEQARGEKVDARSDLFSLGVVLYRMVAGQSPFQRGNSLATLAAVGNVEPLALPGLSAEVGRFIARLMAKKPEQRPKDAGEALAEMPALGTRQARPPRTRWALAGGVVAALLLAGIVIVIYDKDRKKLAEVALEDGAKATITDKKTGKKVVVPPSGAGLKVDQGIHVNSRVRVKASTAGYSDIDRTQHAFAHPVEKGSTGRVSRIDDDQNLCEIELDKPPAKVWVNKDDVEKE